MLKIEEIYSLSCIIEVVKRREKLHFFAPNSMLGFATDDIEIEIIVVTTMVILLGAMNVCQNYLHVS